MSKFTPAQVAIAQMLGALMPTCANEEFFGHLDTLFEECNCTAYAREKVIEIVKAFSEMSHKEIAQIDEMSGIAWLIEQAVKE